MEEAVHLVKNKILDRKTAAQACGVPYSTLCDIVNGKYGVESKPKGKERYLLSEEEIALKTYTIWMAKCTAKKKKQTAPPVECCSICEYELDESGRIRCDTCPKYYHLECLPSPYKALANVTEEWSCPPCISRVESMTCMEVAFTLSNSALWNTCSSCQSSWHNHCMPE